MMKCFKCEKGKMVGKLADMTALVRGEEVPVRTEAAVCDRCGFQILSDDQSAVTPLRARTPTARGINFSQRRSSRKYGNV